MFNCTSSFDECNCQCHHNDYVRHCVPCCNTCPHCFKDITHFSYSVHIKHCEEELNERRKQIQNLLKHSMPVLKQDLK